MSFRSSAYSVVARVFKLLDSNGYTRILLATLTRNGLNGYALKYSDPAFNLTTESSGLWFRDGSADPTSQLYSTSKQAPPTEISAWVETATYDGLSEAGVSINAFSTPKVAQIVVDATATVSTVSISCDTMGGWTNVPASAANWGAAGGFQAPQYRKVGDMVQLRGEVVSTGANAANSVITTLPVNFRPPATINFKTEIAGFFNEVVQINNAGQVICTPAIPGAGSNVSLMLTFYTST